jgi:DNA polymerase-3 subunit gamma/tau
LPGQALYLKWRPALFDEVVGQEHITRTLRSALKSGRIRHAYLFSGPRGTGKTTTARLLAKAVNCHHPDPDARPCNQCPACVAVNDGRYLDLIEIDAATHTGVDDVRDLREKIAFSPGEGRYKVYIIDEVHRFSGSAFDALLKTLEEPPEHAIFVLATTEIDKVPATIKSRCLQFEFRRLSIREVADRLQLIIDAEGIRAERGALEMIAREGTGSLRDSISLLDQIVADPVESITLELVQRILGTASSAAVRDLVEALIVGDAGRGLAILHAAIDSGVDPRQFAAQTVEHLRGVLLAQTAGDGLLEASDAERDLFSAQAQRISRAALIRAVRVFNEANNDLRSSWQPQLGLELALLESLREMEAFPPSAGTPAAVPAASGALTPAQLEQIAAKVARMLPQTAAPPSETPTAPDALETPGIPETPGAPPAVPLAAVQQKWNAMLDQMRTFHKTAPDVIQRYFAPLRVEGTTVYLTTDNQMHFERMQDPERIKVVERALSETHRTRLRVRVVLGAAQGGVQPGVAPPLDPQLSEWAALGMEVHPVNPPTQDE